MMNMAVHRLAGVIQNLRRAAFTGDAGMSDGGLLDRFIEHRDESAFSALVQRHSAMVWGVCRRIVAHHHDAEDAFQATFLVLARKAASIRPREMMANWLFGVARRTALKAKTLAGKRHMREKQVTTMPEPEAADENTLEKLEPLIDQELAKLPDKYRIAIVLCDLEGKKGKDVVRQLKIPEGTLCSRLRAARTMLARRLARYGPLLSGSALATTILKTTASARAPAALVSSTIKAAMLTAAGKTVAAASISANVIALTEGIMKAMLLTKLKTVMQVGLVLGVVAFWGATLMHRAAVAQQPQTALDEASRVRPAVSGTKVPPAKAGPTQPSAPAGDKEKLREVTYPVAELVVPIEGLDDPLNSKDRKRFSASPGGSRTRRRSRRLAPRTKEDWLINKIIRTVSPSSWQGTGGTGTIQYFPLGMTLVVNNTPRVQAQVQYLLETMRRVQDVEVMAETRIILLNSDAYHKLLRLWPELKKDGHVLLSEAEAFVLVRKAKDNKGTTMVRAPNITFFPGQHASFSIDGGIKKTELKLNALVAGNLDHIELKVTATIGETTFTKAVGLKDGMTLVQAKRRADDYLLLLVTPRVILSLEAPEASPPPTGNPSQRKNDACSASPRRNATEQDR
jgi:RNA polymerase sigma factor (sigma-70 family)